MTTRRFIKAFTRMIACLSAVMLLSCASVRADRMLETERFFMREPEYSRIIDVPGRGDTYFYAQNDPLWGGLIYEQAHAIQKRPFRDSGCNPTAAAMALRIVLDDKEIVRITDAAKRPYALCTCSINSAACIWKHDRYPLNAPKDIVKFLPLILGDFATGNNTMATQSRNNAVGTGTGYLHKVAEVYGLNITFTTNFQQAHEAVLAGKGVMTHVGSGGAFTGTGHYVLFAWAEGDTVYFLDPLLRKQYTNDKRKKLVILEPGLVSIQTSDLSYAAASNYIIFSRVESP